MARKPAPKAAAKPAARSRRPAGRQPSPSGGRAGRLARRIAYWSGVAVVWLLVAGIGLASWYAWDLPEVEGLHALERRPSVTLLAGDGTPVATYGDRHAGTVPLDELPDHLVDAVLAIEDRRFHWHPGVDPVGLARAAWRNWQAGRVVEGGSTITQQLAKNAFLTPERSLKRKAQEVLLAFWLEWNFTKDEILALYLNRVYLGSGAWGVEAAAETYFGKSARRLELAESAMLAGLLKAPSRLSPIRDLAAARGRAAVVVAAMADAGFIDDRTAARTLAAPAAIADRGVSGGVRYFADWVLEQVPDFVGRTDRDLIVETTLSVAVQAAAETAVGATLLADAGRFRVGQAALVAMAPDGAVRAMVGGRSYAESQFNRAVQSRRQPGSAFKPVVFLAGLEAGLQPDRRFVDRRVSVDGWSPDNYEGRYRGEVSMADALAHSLNSVAVQVAEAAGRTNVVAAARRLGLDGVANPHPSIALGVAGTSLLDLVSAYTAFAADGQLGVPHGIVQIRDDAGRILYHRRGSGGGQAVLPWHARRMTAMLQRVVADGTGRAARVPGRAVAGKTGTSQDYRDAWFIGYTPQLVAGVWFGNDDNTATKAMTGGSLPAKTWGAFMAAALAGAPALPFAEPPAPRPPSPAAEGDGLLARLVQQFKATPAAAPAPQPERPAGFLTVTRPTFEKRFDP